MLSIDGLLRHSVQQITNSNLCEIQWIQASLPVRDGGLGIRNVTSLALPGFVASAASTLSLQFYILADCILKQQFPSDIHVNLVMHSLEMSQKSCQQNSHSGTDLGCWWIRHC